MSMGRSGLRIATAMLAGLLYFPDIGLVTAEDDHVTARKLRESGQILPLEQILDRARARQPGQILETELERKRNVYVYEVEILDADGRVWELKFDARTGELMELELDD